MSKKKLTPVQIAKKATRMVKQAEDELEMAQIDCDCAWAKEEAAYQIWNGLKTAAKQAEKEKYEAIKKLHQLKPITIKGE